MATVKEAMDAWGRDYLSKFGSTVPDGAPIEFKENLPGSHFCETCGPDPFTVEIRCGHHIAFYYGTLGEIIQDILENEAARSGSL